MRMRIFKEIDDLAFEFQIKSKEIIPLEEQ